MKLLSKISLLFILVGVVLSVTGLALGADTAIHWDNGFRVGQHQGRPIDLNFAAEDFTHIDLNISAGNVRIQQGNSFRLSGNYHGQGLHIDELGDTLSIQSNRRYHNRGTIGVGIGFFRNEQNQLTLTIPENITLEALNATVGLGNIDIADLIAQSAFVQTGAGNIHCRNIHFTDASFHTGAGNIDISGILQGQCNLSSGAGNLSARLDNYEEDVSWRANAGVGNVRHNGQNLGRNSNSRVQNPILQLDLDAGAGNIDFRFR